MSNSNNVEKRLNRYSEAFDFYLNHNKLPENLQNDVLGDYLKTTLDDPGNNHLCKTDDIWMELIKASLLNFFRVLLPLIDKLEEEKIRELEYISQFESGDIHTKRMMWRDIQAYIKRNYSLEEVNIDGYVYMMVNTDCSKDIIFEAMIAEWRTACENRTTNEKCNLIRKNKKILEERVLQVGQDDFETIKKSETVLYDYPSLKEIVQTMGREQDKNLQEEDSYIIRQIPLLLAGNTSHEEVDGIKVSDDLNMLFPSEVALLNDTNTELVFYHKYSSKQLQSFASKPPSIQKEKTEKKQINKPRLQEGPIIVCIDTSGSMKGEPEEIAKSLLLQILQMAKKKKRKCFLITFSVHTKILEISKPGQWHKVKEFLVKRFSGGTDGEQMLKDIINALNTKEYSMADALIISDFEFPYPFPDTRKSILKEQAKGTRFYGLQIGNRHNGYKSLLDKVWEI